MAWAWTGISSDQPARAAPRRSLSGKPARVAGGSTSVCFSSSLVIRIFKFILSFNIGYLRYFPAGHGHLAANLNTLRQEVNMTKTKKCSL
jgi:hypothetical protein